MEVRILTESSRESLAEAPALFPLGGQRWSFGVATRHASGYVVAVR